MPSSQERMAVYHTQMGSNASVTSVSLATAQRMKGVTATMRCRNSRSVSAFMGLPPRPWTFRSQSAGIQLGGITNSSAGTAAREADAVRSEEHTSELQSLMRISYAV